ncbi:MAG: AAA family ATPase [Parvibaculum sp.]|uniref:AAA family ATPase n=1 Tax=Parvibaculum sp. TaxID=2024848 RepID=UPI003C7648FD
MKLSFNSSHLSINEFPDIELPSFTLLTGLNGSGKTHLLTAIQQGKIVVDIAPQTDRDIKFLDWASLVPQDTGLFDGHSLIQEKMNLMNNFDAVKRQYGSIILDATRAAGLTGNYLSDVDLVASLSHDELFSLVGDINRAHAITSAILMASTHILNQFGSSEFRSQIDRAVQNTKRPAAALTRRDLATVELPSWGNADLFQQALGRLFVAYRDLKISNDLKQFMQAKGRSDVTALTDEEFENRYMVAPWVFVNETMEKAGLDFAIDRPDEFSQEPYEPKLKKLSTGVEIFFRDLSSGEKILMSFALCLYYAEDKRQISTYPKLMLLDEVDAPLHPSMSRTLLRAIIDTLVNKHGIFVIMTTHSPSTVALAPENSLFAMIADQPGLHKISKSKALNILTSDVPTLAISYEGRRQVFVESKTDANIYDQAYQALKAHLASERSLEFIPTGIKSTAEKSEINSGCAVVRKLVEALSDSGNNSVFGLIDWDGKNNPTSRIVVLAHCQRDGLENVFLDPLAIAALIAREIPTSRDIIGLTQADSYAALLQWDADRLQTIIDKVQAVILGPEEAGEAFTECEYLGGLKLNVRRTYLTMDDHGLEEVILKKIPELQRISRGRPGGLPLFVAENLYRDQHKFVPLELFAALDKLLEGPSHN